MSPAEQSLELMHALMAKLDRLEKRADRFQPDLQPVDEVIKQLRFNRKSNFYAWCSRQGIKCHKGLVDVSQVYAAWAPE
ncbi:MAG: hypothetical protein AAFX93_20465 [Verrucomicrobiota bacterium]